MKKKKFTYVSADFFFDVDFPVLKGLSKHYDIEWIAIFPIANPRFSIDYLEKFCSKYQINLTVFKRKYSKSHPKTLLLAFKILQNIVVTKPDLKYIENLGDLYFSFFSLFLLSKSNTVLSFHDVLPHSKSKGFLNQKIIFLLSRLFYKNFHFFSKSQTRALNFFNKKNILNTSLMLKDYGLSNIKKDNDYIRFLFFGRIEYYKGLDLLIDAVNALDLDTAVNKFIVTIAGNTNEWSQYENQIIDKSIYDLKIEFIDNKDVPNLFCSSHFLVLPYRDVTQSGPLFIALKYNIPVIAPSYEGFKEDVIDKQTGFLFDYNVHNSLFKTLSRIVSNLNFSNDYTVMVDNLKNHVNSNYSNEVIINKYVNFFNKILRV
jgi:glycosyltransferase involved in cell wall biosynthesis